MNQTRARESMARLTSPGGAFDVDSGRSAMLIRMLELLSAGRPVARDAAEAALADARADAVRVAEFLEAWTQRDTDGTIVGVGLTHTPTPHRITLDGAPAMWAWCALDTLLVTRVLDRAATVESTPPGSGGTVRLTIDPHTIRNADPADAVITLPIRTNDEVDTSSTDAIWRTFCHHSFFFAARADAEHWAEGRDDIAILTPAEGFDIAGDMAAALRHNAASASKNPNTAEDHQALREDIRRHAFRRLLHTGTPVTPAWLAADLGRPQPDLTTAVTDMHDRGQLRLDDQGAITGAAGLSVTPDRHQIDLPGGRFWTWCHYDILGIFGALNADGQATITEPVPLTLRFRHGRPDATDLVLLLPDGDPVAQDCCENTYAEWCPHANLFPDTATAWSWAEGHGIQARIIPIAQAATIATDAWKPLV